MKRSVKIASLSLMAVAMAAIVAVVSPQLFAAQTPTTDASQPANGVAVTASQSDVVDAYNWRTTISPKDPPRR